MTLLMIATMLALTGSHVEECVGVDRDWIKRQLQGASLAVFDGTVTHIELADSDYKALVAVERVWKGLVREIALPLVAGVAAGLFGIFNLASLLQQQGVLFEVKRFEPELYTGVTCALSLLAIFAAWLPARRAAVIDPMVALRSE